MNEPKIIKDKIYEALTIQALHMRREIYFLGGLDRDQFDAIYLNNLGRYERAVAKQEHIEIEE